MNRYFSTYLFFLGVASGLLGLNFSSVRAEFLFNPSNPTDNGFFTPTLTYIQGEYEYSAWDIFYAAQGAANYPDIFAPAGGVYNAVTQMWEPEQALSAGFPLNPNYNPSNPYAFWDTYNPTITQNKSNTAFIIGPDVAGNIYTFQDKTGYQLHHHPDYDQLGTVIFQFQTDGTNVDFSKIRLGYKATDGNTYYLGVNDPETEYLREYSTTGSDHWSATAGYRNRVLLQWDLTGVTGTGEFWIEWESLGSSMSFQKADLLTASYYDVGMPVSSTWVGGNGTWNDSSRWQGQAGSTPLENGNLKFKTSAASTVTINDVSHKVGEIIFENAGDVTLTSTGGQKLIANTGITTRSTASDAGSKVYTFNSAYELGALNFFEINTGKVVMNGGISGGYGIVKSGAGMLEMNGVNSFSGFLAVQDGTVRITGSNVYAGSTTVINGRLIAGNNAALGTGAVTVGGDADLYAYTSGSASWLGELFIEGAHQVNRNITLGAGDLGKRLGGFDSVNGAVFSGNISFSGLQTNPEAQVEASAVGNTFLTAQATSDLLSFSGQMTGGASAKTVTMDGLGTVIYSGANKTYNTSTNVQSGTHKIAAGTSYTGNGNYTISSRLIVDGVLSGGGNLTLNSGSTLGGGGQVNRATTISNNVTITPGDRGVGALAFTNGFSLATGGLYQWEMQNAVGTAGIDYDVINVTGALNLGGLGNNVFTLDIGTLGAAGQALNFNGLDEAALYDWTILTTTQGISNFSSGVFQLSFENFSNTFDPTAFSLGLSSDNRSLILHYQYIAVPEPGKMLLSALGVAFALMMRRRKK